MEQVGVLSFLAPGERVIIQEIDAEESVRQRLHAMGLVRGREVELIRRARFGGPLQIQVGSVCLILRRREADLIKVMRIP